MMMKIFAALSLLLQVAVSVPTVLTFEDVAEANSHGASHWAVLIAGSGGYFNYRHQADICHAYQLLRANGFPKERIITFMKDDVAYSPSNPTKGQLINHPGGKDVYQGVVKDYTGASVTPQIFMDVLLGNEDAVSGVGSGKVLKSTKKDKVFIYFADHGAVGLIAFPRGFLTSSDLMKTLKTMHKRHMYKELVFYLEACESGSMFEGLLPDDINIFATTAANAHQSSYACYYDSERRTFLGDCYSVNWMEDSDKHFLARHQGLGAEDETLQKQYKVVKELTAKYSEVHEYGDLTMSKKLLEEFQQFETPAQDNEYFISAAAANSFVPPAASNSVNSRDVTTYILQQHLEAAETAQEKVQIELKIRAEENRILNAKARVYSVMDNFSHIMDLNDLQLAPFTEQDHSCLHHAIHAFDKYCSTMDEYHIRFTNLFAKACQHSDINTNQIMDNIVAVCDVEN